MLNEMLEEEGYGVWYGESKIAFLLFMDNAIIVEEDPEKFQTALNIAQKYTMVYKLVLNKSKSKVMITRIKFSEKAIVAFTNTTVFILDFYIII